MLDPIKFVTWCGDNRSTGLWLGVSDGSDRDTPLEKPMVAVQPNEVLGQMLAMLQRSIFLKEQARAQLALHEGAVRLWSKVGFDLETSARARDDAEDTQVGEAQGQGHALGLAGAAALPAARGQRTDAAKGLR